LKDMRWFSALAFGVRICFARNYKPKCRVRSEKYKPIKKNSRMDQEFFLFTSHFLLFTLCLPCYAETLSYWMNRQIFIFNDLEISIRNASRQTGDAKKIDAGKNSHCR
jgi:hypothetical protein